MDDGEAWEGDDTEPGKTRQWMRARGEEYERSLVRLRCEAVVAAE